jgi:NodT family efflux transporter outer membrane factor (OMF) lipoprotein
LNKNKLNQIPPLARHVGLSVAISMILGGCAVGPDFKRPEAPANAGNSYTPAPMPAETVSTDGASGTSGIAQRFVQSREIPAQWWTLFHSDALDQLIRSALEKNPSMDSAQAALREAQENYNAQVGNALYPTVSGQLGMTREHASPFAIVPGGPRVFNLYNASVNVSYGIDLFGGARRALEGLEASVDYQRYQVEATYLTLTSNIVTTAVKEASLRAQLQATHEVIDAQQKQSELLEKQFELGAIPRSTLLLQRNQLAQTMATLPALEKSLALTRHQLSVLAGKLPSEEGMPEFQLDSLTLPQDLPVSLPSELVRQRPDIQASEALLHEASAAVGVATANQYPQLTLNGTYGSSNTKFHDLFANGTTFWSIGAALTQPIFNGGALSAKKRAAVAAYDQAAAQYRATVLTAFQNVADTLRALELDAATLKAQSEAESLAHESLDLATKQYQLGAISYLTLLDAQRTYQQAHISLVQAQAARYADTAALFQALGGGWWNRRALADAAPTTTTAKKD